MHGARNWLSGAIMWLCIAVVCVCDDNTTNNAAVLVCDGSSGNATFRLQSNTVYVIQNCTLPSDSEPFIRLVGGAGRNITVVVDGGNALPLLEPDPTNELIENIAVTIRRVCVGPVVLRPDDSSPLAQRVVFNAPHWHDVVNISIVVEDSVIDVVMRPTVQVNGVLFAYIFAKTVMNVSVMLRNVSVQLNCTGSGVGSSCSQLGLVDIAATRNVVNVIGDFVNSTADLRLDCTNDTTYVVSGKVALISVTSDYNISMVSLVLRNRTSVAVQTFSPSGDQLGSNQMSAAVFSIPGGGAWLSNLHVAMHPESVVVARCVCTEFCDTRTALSTAYALLIGRFANGDLVTVVVDGGNYHVEASLIGAVVSVGVNTLTRANILIASSSVRTAARSLIVVGLVRVSRVLILQAKMMEDVLGVLRDIQFVATSESGGTREIAVTVMSIDGDSQTTYISIHNVTQVTSIVNGTVLALDVLPGFRVGQLTVQCALLTWSSVYSKFPMAKGATLSVSDSNLSCGLSTTPPVSFVPTTLVVSLTAAVTAAITLEDSSVALLNVYVVRDTVVVSAPSSEQALITQYNITVLISFADKAAAFPPSFAMFVSNATVPTYHHNVSTKIDHCNVDYARPLVTPVTTDTVALMLAPNAWNRSRVTMAHTTLLPRFPHTAPAGTILVFAGGADVRDSDIVVDQMVGGASLFYVDIKNVTLSGMSTFVFHNISISGNASFSTIKSGEGSVWVGDPRMDDSFLPRATTVRAPYVSVGHSQFHGFITMIDNNTIRLAATITRSVLRLGCNLWDGVPMPHTMLGHHDASLQGFIEYPPSAYNATTLCAGLPTSHTQSADAVNALATPALVRRPLALPHVLSLQAATVLYVSFLPSTTGFGRSAVSGIQRAIAALRLSDRCVAARQDTDDAEYSDDAPMFSQLVDNPLNLEVGVGSDALIYAAGAAVGNAVVVAAIAAILHVAHGAKHCARTSPSGFVAAALLVLPSSSLPGSIAVAYSRVVQPAVGACVALLVSGERSARSVACGTTMLALWLGYPLYCVVAVLHRGRRRGVFLVSSVGARPRRHKDATTAAASVAQTVQGAVEYATAETARWVPHRGCARQGTAERKYAEFLLHNMEAVFGAFVSGREWYFAVEWGIAAASGAVLGAAEAVAAGGDACTAARWGGGSAVALCVLQLGLCVWLRPYSVRLELWMAVLLGCLELLSNALSLAALVDAAGVVVNLTMVVELSVAVLMMLVFSSRVLRVSMAAAFTASPGIGVNAVCSVTNVRGPLRRRRVVCDRVRCELGDVKETKATVLAPIDTHSGLQLLALIQLICSRADENRKR